MHLLEPGGRKFVGLASPPEEEGADVAISPASSPQKSLLTLFPREIKAPQCYSRREENRTMEDLD